MEEIQEYSQKPEDGDVNEERSLSSTRRRTGPGHRPRRPLFLRCLLIRNLPKGFVGWSDLTDKNTPIRVRRIVYCEESNGSIMVEFMSEAERNKILSLDQQRRRRIRQRIQEQEGSNANSNKSYAYEIKVTVERCTSERFVRTVLSGGADTNSPRRVGRSDYSEQQSSEEPSLLTGTFTAPTSPLAGPPPSPMRSSRLVRRCIVIRKILNPDNVEEDLEIPEAPPYERQIRLDDGSVRSADMPKQRRQSMEIRSGNLSELVVRANVLRNKSKMIPAMVVELESEESVDRILRAEKAKKQMENSQPTTLAIPVEIHAVKSERYARLCFANTRSKPDQRKPSSSIETNTHVHEVKIENDVSVDEESHVEIKDETTNAAENSDFLLNLETREDRNENNDNETIRKKQIENLEKEIDDVRKEMDHWKQQAMAANSRSSKDNFGGQQNSSPIEAATEKAHNPESSLPEQIKSRTSEEPSRHQEWIEERRKNEILEKQVRELLAENNRLKAAEAAEAPVDEKKETLESSQEEQEQKYQSLSAENENLKALVAQMGELESDLKQSRAHLKKVEEARNKLEDDNSGLLRYVLELEGHRSGKAIADEERVKELEKKHSDLSTLYRFVQAQAENSANELHQAIEERELLQAELEGFKSAWKTRMETQRRLEESKGSEDEMVCIDCETVKFYTMLEECKKNHDANDTIDLGEESNNSSFENEPATVPKASIGNNMSPGHQQTNGQTPELLMT